ncbi:MAG: hypothetical protein GF388_06555 [Candidatus Aegiribacteria sp.]|nr:hypothetical protein [Candidatus Aegiribacteria sp.]MBD3294812.1 hypothetical protein [Candidatus Fermentibacteria bacterium]
MSLEAILEKIQQDALEETRNLRNEAESEKKEALKEHADELRDSFGSEAEKIRRRIDEAHGRKEYHVRKEAERTLMNARRELIDRALEKAVDNLASSSDEDYLEMVSSLLKNCGLKGEIQVIISPSDQSRITKEFLKEHSGDGREFVLSEDRLDSSRGGVVFRSGKISENGTFPMIAELVHEDLVMKLSKTVPIKEIR